MPDKVSGSSGFDGGGDLAVEGGVRGEARIVPGGLDVVWVHEGQAFEVPAC